MKLTVCGSIAFYKEMEKLGEQLRALGHEVKIPELEFAAPAELGGTKKIYIGEYIEKNGGMDAFAPDHPLWDQKEKAIRDHYAKVDWAEAVVVANYEKRGMPGYIGGNTLIEIGLAFYQNKKIFVLNPISSQLLYRQEIYAMKPVLLNGDLRLIK